MSEIIYSCPATFAAGDTISWVQPSESYKYADGWTMFVIFINDTNKYTVTSTVGTSGGYQITIPAIDSSGYASGNYHVVAYVSNGTQRYTISESDVNITPDLATVSTYDSRSQARKTLDAIESAILASATENQLSMTWNGRSISRMNITELIAAKNHFKQVVASEENAKRIAEGKPAQNTVYIRFV